MSFVVNDEQPAQSAISSSETTEMMHLTEIRSEYTRICGGHGARRTESVVASVVPLEGKIEGRNTIEVTRSTAYPHSVGLVQQSVGTSREVESGETMGLTRHAFSPNTTYEPSD